MRRHVPPLRRRSLGFTLVELMVSTAIGLVMVAGLVVMFANTSQSSRELDKSVRLIENGRYAVDLLTEDISTAGYFGAVPVYTSTATVSPCEVSSVVATDLEGQRAAPTPTTPFGIEGSTPAEAAALTCLTNHQAGTPALILRRLDTTALPAASVTSGLLYVQTSNSALDINARYVAGTNTATFTLHDRDGSINTVRRYLSRVYFIASCNECGQDTVPTLKRAELNGNQITVTPLAEGIERIGFDYGFDTDGDGIPDQWMGLNGTAGATESAAGAALGWGNVVAVKVSLLARTTEPGTMGFAPGARTYSGGLNGTVTTTIGPYSDSYKRQAYVVMARVNNLAGQREAP